ncbi:MAG: hypothetical protein E7018_01655 [Alphaproteobacteria bacterium]|nr:hypothetical protein [Alphaproteobacteria bacterium]
MEKTIIELKSVHLIDRFGFFQKTDKEKDFLEFMRNPSVLGIRVISNQYHVSSPGKFVKTVSNKIEYYIRGVEMTAREIIEHRPISKSSERVLRQILSENIGQEDNLIFICYGGTYFLKKANMYTVAL